MRILWLTLMCSACYALEGPRPIPAERQEQLSRAMINLQSAQLKATVALAQAKDAAAAANAKVITTQDEIQKYLTSEETKYQTLINALRKEFHAEACPGNPDVKPELTAEKTWMCPPAKEPTK